VVILKYIVTQFWSTSCVRSTFTMLVASVPHPLKPAKNICGFGTLV